MCIVGLVDGACRSAEHRGKDVLCTWTLLHAADRSGGASTYICDSCLLFWDRLFIPCSLLICTRFPVNRYLVLEGTKQLTLKGRQWCHGVIYWPFIVSGLLDNFDGTAACPTLASWKLHKAQKRESKKRQNTAGNGDTPYTECSDDSTSHEEDGEDNQVPTIEGSDYDTEFGDMPPRDAVLEVIGRAAVLMGKLCDDNQAEDAEMSDTEARELATEAYQLVTKYVAALFGPLHKTKMLKLAYHLLEELVLRGNLVDADTSVNEILHNLVNVMWVRTNKQRRSPFKCYVLSRRLPLPWTSMRAGTCCAQRASSGATGTSSTPPLRSRGKGSGW